MMKVLQGAMIVALLQGSRVFAAGEVVKPLEHSFHHNEIVAFQVAVKIRDLVFDLIKTYDPKKIGFLLDPRVESPDPHANYQQTKQGLRIMLDENGVPDELATPWGTIELCGIYATNNFFEDDAQKLLDLLRMHVELQEVKTGCFDVISCDGVVLPKTIMAKPREFVPSSQVLQRWQLLIQLVLVK